MFLLRVTSGAVVIREIILKIKCQITQLVALFSYQFTLNKQTPDPVLK